MHPSKHKVMEIQIGKTLDSLRRNGMDAQYVEFTHEVPDAVRELLREGETVAVGGSETLFETGVLDLLRNGNYRFLDRYAPELNNEQRHQVFRDSFFADTYLMSTNAVTMKGELYNVDGTGNRVAALLYGPKSVIIVAGYNKIVPNIKAAVQYVKRVSAPANVARLNRQTYCAAAGVCMGVEGDDPQSGCSAEDRICCGYVISAQQQQRGRIKVILVGEELGF